MSQFLLFQPFTEISMDFLVILGRMWLSECGTNTPIPNALM